MIDVMIQCAEICGAAVLGMCIGLITGALTMYALLLQQQEDEPQAQQEQRNPFDADEWIRHYERIAGIPEQEER